MAGLEITVNPEVIRKIQGYFNDPSYKEMVENAAQFNSRLGAERTMRLPFLDNQTGVAQNHSNLFMEPHQRLPGMKEGQIYTYPSKRWQKKRRQYLHNFMQPRFNLRKENGDGGEGPSSGALLENSSFTAGPSSGSSGGVGPIPSSTSGPMIGGAGGGGASCGNPTNIQQEQESSNKETPKPDPEITKQDWFYDELDVPDAGEFDEPDADSDYDYEESYSSKRKKKKTPAKTPRQQNKNRRKITYDPIGDSEKPFACDLCGARYKTRPGLTYHYTHSHKEKEDDEEEMDMDKRGGDEASRRRSGGGGNMPPPILHPQQPMPPTLQPQQPMSPSHHMGMGPMPPPSMMHQHHHHPPPPHLVPQQPHPHMPPHHQMYHHQPPPGSNMPPPGSYHHQQQGMSSQPPQQQQQHPHAGSHPGLMGGPMGSRPPIMQHPGSSGGNHPQPGGMNHPGPGGVSSSGPSNSGGGPGGPVTDDPNFPRKMDDGKPRVPPSPYCDFCLGDAVENKKSGIPEELVSCSDCGRSGHPTCLQFTNNMIISVKKYRWQCIECKCCSLCGTSDNDDQLLFCDDCDRGYHMYCLVPKLDAPPEGSWSCTLCLGEFHHKK
ncbi:zinc finger protein ubi-d4 [Folsomia candida]|uniref:zinc finger protein ubi-d4 n=1 Tax=Folsomia candida TaxID=158441 RepID=UPI000B8F476F|nr:zinc finger protein ubi-d4 [Folsomia candida]